MERESTTTTERFVPLVTDRDFEAAAGFLEGLKKTYWRFPLGMVIGDLGHVWLRRLYVAAISKKAGPGKTPVTLPPCRVSADTALRHFRHARQLFQLHLVSTADRKRAYRASEIVFWWHFTQMGSEQALVHQGNALH